MSLSRKWMGEELVFTNQSGAQTTAPFDVPLCSGITVKAGCTTGGTLVLQAARDDGTTWDDIATLEIAEASTDIVILDALPGNAVRAVLTPASAGDGIVQIAARP